MVAKLQNAQERQIVLIAGGTGGIGGHVATGFAATGATVILASRTASASPLARELQGSFPDAIVDTVDMDICDVSSCRAAAERVRERHGRLDSMVNATSVSISGITGPFLKTDPAMFGRAAEISLAANAVLCQVMHPLLAERGGAIVMFSSDAAIFSAPNQAIIAATRAGIVAFARNYALEASADKIRVNCVTTSYVRDTPSFDAFVAQGFSRIDRAVARAKLGLPSPDDIVPTVLFLCSPGAEHLTGQVLSINGGLST